MLARQIVGQGLAIGRLEPEGLQIPRQRLASHAYQLPFFRGRVGVDGGAGAFQHLDLAARLNPALVEGHQVLAEVDLAILAAPIAGEGSQRLFEGIEAIRARFHRGHDAAAAGLGDPKLHLADADPFPAVFLEGEGAACHQVGTKLAHLVQRVGSQVEILKRGLADQQQGIAVGKADPGTGLLPKAGGLFTEPEQLNRLPRHLAQPLIGLGLGLQGAEAVAPDPGGPRSAGKLPLLQDERVKARITQLQTALDGGGHHLLQLGMGAGGDEAAVRLDHHVAAIPLQPLFGDQGAGQWHACRRLDGVEMNAGELGHGRVLVLWWFQCRRQDNGSCSVQQSLQGGRPDAPSSRGPTTAWRCLRGASPSGDSCRRARCYTGHVVHSIPHKVQHFLILIRHSVHKSVHHRVSFQFLTLSLLPPPATVCPGKTVSSAFGWGLSHKKKKAMYEQTTGYDPTAGSLPENGNRPGPYSATRLAAGPATLQPCLPGWREHPGLACPGRSRPL